MCAADPHVDAVSPRRPKRARGLLQDPSLALLAALLLSGQETVRAAVIGPESSPPPRPAARKTMTTDPALAPAVCDLSNPLLVVSDPAKVVSGCPQRLGIFWGSLLVAVVLLVTLAEKLDVLHRLVRWLLGQIRRASSSAGTASPSTSRPPGPPLHPGRAAPPEAGASLAEGGPLSRRNPFGDRGCIRDPERFFNREELLAELFDALRKGTSLSLVGEKQVGKSSLLAMIGCLGPKALQRDPNHFVHIDMQVIRNEEEFFDALCEQLGFSARRGLALDRALKDRRVVVCLDEIEKMMNPQSFSGEERSELRGHANGPDSPLTLVIASRSPLATLFDDDPRFTSPLADLCSTQRVGPFSQATSEAFLLHRLQGNAVTFTAKQRQGLHEQSQGHPGQLQAMAAELYRQLAPS